MSNALALQDTAAMESIDTASCPQNRLMLAILEEALVTFQRGIESKKAEQRRQFYEVDHWVASHDTDWPFSFENICSCLMLDPDYVRSGLHKMKEKVYLKRGGSLAARRLRRERIYARRGWRGQIK